MTSRVRFLVGADFDMLRSRTAYIGAVATLAWGFSDTVSGK